MILTCLINNRSIILQIHLWIGKISLLTRLILSISTQQQQKIPYQTKEETECGQECWDYENPMVTQAFGHLEIQQNEYMY